MTSATDFPFSIDPMGTTVQASIAAKTYVISGAAETKSKSRTALTRRRRRPHRMKWTAKLATHHASTPFKSSPLTGLQELLPNILHQLGGENISALQKQFAEQLAQGKGCVMRRAGAQQSIA
jgi:hypothetical protein